MNEEILKLSELAETNLEIILDIRRMVESIDSKLFNSYVEERTECSCDSSLMGSTKAQLENLRDIACTLASIVDKI